jgi:hypothetical protein
MWLVMASNEDRIIAAWDDYKNISMNPGMTYIKTDKGRAELAGRSHALDAVQRRLLILVDGNRTVNDLAVFVRAGELDDSLEYLLAEGLIESTDYVAPLQAPVAPGFAATAEAEEPRAASSPKEFNILRQQASDFVSERLGPAGEPICEAIDRCQNPDELRKMLRGVEIFVGQRLDTETTQAFARHFGTLLL